MKLFISTIAAGALLTAAADWQELAQDTRSGMGGHPCAYRLLRILQDKPETLSAENGIPHGI